MQYLVLQRFRSYNRTLEKGMIVDEQEIRSPRLRQSEGKLIPAVSSSKVPVEFGTEEPAPQDTLRKEDTPPQVIKFQIKS